MSNQLSNFTIFCEDVRSEANNKVSLNGCMQDTLYFAGSYPTSLRLNAVCHIFMKEGNLKDKFLYISAPAKEQKPIDLSGLPPTAAGAYIRAVLDLSAFVFEADGEILIHLGPKKGKKELIGRILINAREEIPFPFASSIEDHDVVKLGKKKKSKK